MGQGIVEGLYQGKLKLVKQHLEQGDSENLKVLLAELRKISYTQEVKELEDLIDRPALKFFRI